MSASSIRKDSQFDLANISYRLGEEVSFNTKTESLGDYKKAETLARMEEYLAKENELKLAGLHGIRTGHSLFTRRAGRRGPFTAHCRCRSRYPNPRSGCGLCQ